MKKYKRVTDFEIRSPCLYCDLLDEPKTIAEGFRLRPECAECRDRIALVDYFYYEARRDNTVGDTFDTYAGL